ncbi:MAG: TIGR01777 family protein [Elusimicrobia bacterium]|nr:TIGR01777 family protein [Elusimicrobiota bacterium]
MRILVCGGTGFVGRHLCRHLAGLGHEVVVVSRAEGPAPAGAARRVSWDKLLEAVESAEAVVNLSGAGVADGRWSARRKVELKASRLTTTSRVVQAILAAKRKPEVLVNASAVGYYGDRGEEKLVESSVPGGGFLAELCMAWENEAERASEAGVRVVTARIGVVLGIDGGALPRMLPPFRLGLGGPLGSGRQYMSWIHIDDAVGLLWLAASRRELKGPLNVTAPAPATNREFSRALAASLHRPCLFVVPGFILRGALGEMAELLLGGQRVEPAAALGRGYTFRFPELGPALTDLTHPLPG